MFVYLVYHGFHYGCGCVSFALRWLMSPFDFENVNLLSSSASLSSILIHVLNAKRLRLRLRVDESSMALAMAMALAASFVNMSAALIGDFDLNY